MAKQRTDRGQINAEGLNVNMELDIFEKKYFAVFLIINHKKCPRINKKEDKICHKTKLSNQSPMEFTLMEKATF